ncbi:MAG: 16S rRNA (guanine(527)-N(7))-methyltransferase RsmG [Kiritimatiellaeota bacterium]|nr:16S rRNA (guanine(527)-N(7))-methyltransferase RsmG [Kiritimatiellota bacterium]
MNKFRGSTGELEYADQVLRKLKHHPPDIKAFAAGFTDMRLLLIRENLKSNLTRVTESEEFWVKHVFDSLLVADAYPEAFTEGASFADIGCGAGFPSLVLAAAFPKIRFTAIDSRAKKTAFVSLAARRLGLRNITVVTGRGRELARKKEFQNRFDVVTARAVADAATVFREVRAMLAPRAEIILYKSPGTVETEIREASAAKTTADLRWSASSLYALPYGMGERVFLRGSRDFESGR